MTSRAHIWKRRMRVSVLKDNHRLHVAQRGVCVMFECPMHNFHVAPASEPGKSPHGARFMMRSICWSPPPSSMRTIYSCRNTNQKETSLLVKLTSLAVGQSDGS